MNVLSLFDGMSCGQIALERAGIKVDNYFASEIDKYAMQVTKHNYPNTKHIGDVTKVKGDELPKIDLLIGGSPCQGFSFAGKQLNFKDPRSKLFFEFVRLLEETKPKYFLLENVKMKKEYQEVISKHLGCEPIEINSALVSGQNRRRLYWTNIPNIDNPKNKGILLKDVLESNVDEKYFYSEKAISYLDRNKINKRFANYSDSEKANCLTAVFSKSLPYNVYVDQKKSYCLTSNYGNMACINYNKGQGQIVFDNKTIRRLTPIECERLQTVPDNEIICIFTSCLDQAKNYVNAVEQNPKLLKLALSAEKEELNDFVKLAIQNTKQSNPKTKFTVPQNVGMQIQNQTNQCTKVSQKENNTTVRNAENIVMFKNQNQEVDSVLPNAFINIIEGRIMHFGKGELRQRDKSYTNQLNGSKPLVLFGKEIMELVKDVGVGMKKNNDMSSISTTLSVLSTSSLEQILATYYLFAKIAITGYTQDTTNQRNISVQFKISDGYTSCVSNTQRYKMLGNGWTVDVIAHIFSFLKKDVQS